MRRFQVTVNGTAYDVAVEETASDAGSVQPEVALQQEHSTEKQAVPDGTPISAPMTGTILELQVQVGDAVQSGQTVAVLEAMKMANDLVAPENGVIAAILVQKGAQVQSGQPLLILQQEAVSKLRKSPSASKIRMMSIPLAAIFCTKYVTTSSA